MAQILELSNKYFKIIIMKILNNIKKNMDILGEKWKLKIKRKYKF